MPDNDLDKPKKPSLVNKKIKRKAGRPKGTSFKQEQALNYFRAYPSASIKECHEALISQGLGIGRRTVSAARDRFVKIYTKAEKAPDGSLSKVIPVDSLKLEAPRLDKNLEFRLTALINAFDGDYDTADMRHHLKSLGKQATADSNLDLQFKCIAAIRDLDNKSQEKRAIGPPDPITDAEKVLRTADILDCVGPLLTAKAIKKTFSSKSLEILLQAVQPHTGSA